MDPQASDGRRRRNVNVAHSGSDRDPGRLSSSSEVQKNDYRLLYKAALDGAESGIFPQNPEAYNDPITGDSKTVLHVAAGTGTTNGNLFISEVLQKMSKDALAQVDDKGETALSIAAEIGNLKAAEMMIDKNPDLPYIPGEDGCFPIHKAAQYGRKEMVEYLFDHPSGGVDDVEAQQNPYEGLSGFLLLQLLITAQFYGIALKLVERHSELLSVEYMNREDSPLALIAGQPEAFLRGNTFNGLQSWVYNALTRNIYNKKLNHGHLLVLVEKFCNVINALDTNEVKNTITKPFLLAAKLGIHELVKVIVLKVPTAIWLTDEEGRNALQVAVLNRHENVFSLIYHMKQYQQSVIKHRDVYNNNILHLAGKLAPVDTLNRFPEPALQLQRGVQWFKTIDTLEPSFKYMKNNSGLTPLMVFNEEHKQLLKDGEKQMKETAQSCTFVASLIAPIVFTAGINVPGGIHQTGLPVFTNQKSFTILIVATAISLFSSISSVIVFLSILTTPYTIDKFLYDLPNRLIIGLFTLFLSVIAMLIAFSASIYLVTAENKIITLFPLYVLAGLTVISFMFSQCPLLWRMLKSTYYGWNTLSKKK